MKKQFCITLLMGALALESGVLNGQGPQPPSINTSQLQGTLSLDRNTYFPGEAAFLTVSLRNPASTALEVPRPFSAATGCFTITRLMEGGSSAVLSAKPICPFRYEENTGLTTIFAGLEQRQTTLSSEALASALRRAVPASGSLTLNRPGYYQIQYDYSHSSGVFRVVQPRLDASTVVKLQDVAFIDPKTRRFVRIPAYRHVFALRWNNQSFICVSQFSESRDRAVSGDAHGEYAGRDFPFVRIASSPNPVTALSASADAQDHLVITWLDSKGQKHIKLFDGAQSDQEASDLQIALDSTFQPMTAAGAQQFTATVTGSANTDVKWGAAVALGAPAGAEPGTVSASGLYLAPSKVFHPYMVIITARSRADESRSALAVVSLSPAVPAYTSAASFDPTERMRAGVASMSGAAVPPAAQSFRAH